LQPICRQLANLITLNSSKTEFLLIGLKKQVDKIHNSSLNTTHSARNLGFIFDEHLTFVDQISAISKACYYHITDIRQLCCIRPYQFILQQRAPMPPPSFALNSTTVIRFTTNSLSLIETSGRFWGGEFVGEAGNEISKKLMIYTGQITLYTGVL